MMLYRLGPVLTDFGGFLTEDTAGVSKHKLDSYVCKSASQEADLFFLRRESSLKQELLNGARELRAYPYDIYFAYVHLLSDGSSLYTYARRDTREVLLQYHISRDYRRINVTVDNLKDGGYSAFGGFSDLFSYYALSKDMITFHSVLLEDEGRGILISANSGVGKTTHARLWRDERNSLIIDGDRGFCRLEGDSYMGYGLPWCGTSGESINRKVPIRVFVSLKRGTENTTRVLNGMEAFQTVLTQVKYPKWDLQRTEKVMDILEDFLTRVPVIELSCRPDADAVAVLEHTIREL